MINRLFKPTFTALLLVLAIPTVAFAHGSSFSFKYIDGSNVVMITHNVHDLQAGVPISYNVRLYDMEGKPVPFDTVQTEFKLGAKSIDKQTLNRSQNNDVTLTYTYPEEGEYTLTTTFFEGEKQVAHGEFPIVAEKGHDNNLLATIFSTPVILAFLLGATATRLCDARSQFMPRMQSATTKTPAPPARKSKSKQKTRD